MKKCCRSSIETMEGLCDYGVNVSAMQPLSVRWALEPFQRVQQFILLRDGLQPIIMGFVGCVDIILDWNSCLQHSLAVCISVGVSAATKPIHSSPLFVTRTNTAALDCGLITCFWSDFAHRACAESHSASDLWWGIWVCCCCRKPSPWAPSTVSSGWTVLSTVTMWWRCRLRSWSKMLTLPL